jgi:hypothetical protein
MARQCLCGENSVIDMWHLPENNNLQHVVPACARCAPNMHRKPRNKPRDMFYLRSSMEAEQVQRAILGSA